MQSAKQIAAQRYMVEWTLIRAGRALQLRYQGCTYRDIGDVLGVSRARAQQLVRKAEYNAGHKPRK